MHKNIDIFEEFLTQEFFLRSRHASARQTQHICAQLKARALLYLLVGEKNGVRTKVYNGTHLCRVASGLLLIWMIAPGSAEIKHKAAMQKQLSLEAKLVC